MSCVAQLPQSLKSTFFGKKFFRSQAPPLQAAPFKNFFKNILILVLEANSATAVGDIKNHVYHARGHGKLSCWLAYIKFSVSRNRLCIFVQIMAGGQSYFELKNGAPKMPRLALGTWKVSEKKLYLHIRHLHPIFVEKLIKCGLFS